jgi:hypothetical protein
MLNTVGNLEEKGKACDMEFFKEYRKNIPLNVIDYKQKFI